MTRGAKKKIYQKQSLAAQLFGLEVGDRLCLLPKESADRTMKDVQSIMVKQPQLEGRKFQSQRWMLVREEEMVQPAVIVTRTE